MTQNAPFSFRGWSLMVLAIALAASVQWVAAQQPTNAGKQFRILSIKRANEYPPSPHTAVKAKDGYEFLAVTFVPLPLKSVDDFPDDRDVVLVDSIGEKHNMAYVLFNGEQMTLAFAVKLGAKAQEMIVKDLHTDLTKIPEAATPRPVQKSTQRKQ